MDKPLIFIGYSHKDQEWMESLKTHLNVLYYQGFCEIFTDQDTSGGEEWKQSIFIAIDKLQIAVLLISSNFLSSKFINEEEIPRILSHRENKGILIYPIKIKPCSTKHVKWLEKLLIRPKDGKALSLGDANQRDSNLSEIVDEIGEQIRKLGVEVGNTIHDRELRESYRPSPTESIRQEPSPIIT